MTLADYATVTPGIHLTPYSVLFQNPWKSHHDAVVGVRWLGLCGDESIPAGDSAVDNVVAEWEWC